MVASLKSLFPLPPRDPTGVLRITDRLLRNSCTKQTLCIAELASNFTTSIFHLEYCTSAYYFCAITTTKHHLTALSHIPSACAPVHNCLEGHFVRSNLEVLCLNTSKASPYANLALGGIPRFCFCFPAEIYAHRAFLAARVRAFVAAACAKVRCIIDIRPVANRRHVCWLREDIRHYANQPTS